MADTRAIVSDPAGTLFVVDLTAQTILATFTPSTPGTIAVLPNATEAYITDNNAVAGDVYTLALPSNVLGPTIVIGPARGSEIKASPDGTHVYVGTTSTGTITPIATPANTVGAGIVTGSGNVNGIAVNPASTRLYAVTPFDGIWPITIPANTVGANFGAATLAFTVPGGIVVMPSGITGYVGTGAASNVYPVNFLTATVGAAIPTTATTVRDVFLTPDGTHLFVPDGGSNAVIVISTATNLQVASVTLTGGGGTISGGFDSAGTTFYVPSPSTGQIFSINTSTFALGPIWAFGGSPRYIAVVPTPPPPPTPPFPGGQFIPKLFIPQKGKVNVDYTPDELRANWMAIEIWSQRWLPPPTTALLFPHKNDPTPEGVNANWITLEVWGQVIKNLGAPYTPLFVPRKPSVKPEDLDIAFLAVQNWANRLPL